GKIPINHQSNVPLDGRKTWQCVDQYSRLSILKQFLEVKFEEKKRRQLKLLRDVGMQLAQITERRLAIKQIDGFARVKRCSSSRNPSDRITHIEEFQDRFDEALGS